MLTSARGSKVLSLITVAEIFVSCAKAKEVTNKKKKTAKYLIALLEALKVIKLFKIFCSLFIIIRKLTKRFSLFSVFLLLELQILFLQNDVELFQKIRPLFLVGPMKNLRFCELVCQMIRLCRF
ncbi:hypothetical protein D3C72_919820 [compost metagenome]